MSTPSWQTSRMRRYAVTAAIMVLVTFGGIAALLHKERRPPQPTLPDFYREGMRELKGDERKQNLDEAKSYFSAALLANDPRGNFGIACVLWQRYPEIARYGDGPAGQRMELAQEQLQYAADHGVIAAQAALVSYDLNNTFGVLTRGDEVKAMARIIVALKNASNLDDPALPSFRLSVSDIEPYLAATFGSGLCAPTLSKGAVHDLLLRANESLQEARGP